MGLLITVMTGIGLTAAETALACWLGNKEEIFRFLPEKKGYLLALVVGNLLLFLFSIYQEYSGGQAALWYFGIWSYLFCLAIYDLKCRELPDLLHLLPVLPYLILWAMGWQPIGITESLLAAFIAAAAFGLVYVIRKDAIGLGDIKLILVCALYLGHFCSGVLVRGMAAAFVCSIVLLLCKKVTAKSGLPFVPFLFVGALLL